MNKSKENTTMKIAIKRVQRQAMLGYAEREQFGAKLKKLTWSNASVGSQITLNSITIGGKSITPLPTAAPVP